MKCVSPAPAGDMFVDSQSGGTTQNYNDLCCPGLKTTHTQIVTDLLSPARNYTNCNGSFCIQLKHNQIVMDCMSPALAGDKTFHFQSGGQAEVVPDLVS